MPERWERELRKLRESEMPEGVRPRAEEGPRGHGAASPRQRIVAATVAFAVFLGAGVFAWQAFRPTGEGTPGGDAREPGITEAVVTFMASGGGDPDLPFAELAVNGRTVQGQLGISEWRGTIFNIAGPSFVDPIPLPLGTRLIIAGDADAVAGLFADPASMDPLEDLRLSDRGGYVMAEPGEYFLLFEAKWHPDVVPFYFPIEVRPVEPDLTDRDAELEINAYPFEAILSYGGQRVAFAETSGTWRSDGKAIATGGASAEPSGEVPAWARISIPAGTPLRLSGNWEDWTNRLQPGDSEVAADDQGALVFPSGPGRYRWTMSASWPQGEAEFMFGVELIGASLPQTPTDLITVPDVVGLRDQRAMLTLDTLGLILDPAYRAIEGVPQWRVSETDPAPGTAVEPGTRVKLVIATEISPLPTGAVEALECPPDDHVAFGGPRVRILPGGSAYITGNLGRVKDAEVVQATFEAGQTEWDGLWHVVLNDHVIGVVDFQSLDGVACRGTGFAGA